MPPVFEISTSIHFLPFISKIQNHWPLLAWKFPNLDFVTFSKLYNCKVFVKAKVWGKYPTGLWWMQI